MIKQLFPFQFHFFSISKSFLYFVFIAVILAGCKDDPYQIGLELLPAEDSLYVDQDILTLEAFTIGPVGIPVYDSLNLPVGNYHDPVFGQTSASLMFELSPGSYNSVLKQDITVDTTVMYIFYDTIYGNTLYRPQLEVYSLTQGIDKSARYASDYDINGKYNIANLVTEVTEYTDSIKRIKLFLNNEFGDAIIRTEGLNDSVLFTTYKKDSVFDANFQGLYLKTLKESIDRGIINVYSINLVVYFHADTINSFISFSFSPQDNRYLKSVPMGDKCIKIFNHDYSESKIAHLNSSTVQDTALYLQSLGGTQIKLIIPYLEQLKQTIGRVSVNSAELFIPVLSDSAELADNFYPKQLGMRLVGDETAFITDDILYATRTSPTISLMNGRFSNTLWGYKFILTGFFHEYMKGNITANQFQIFAGRLDTNPYVYHTNLNPSFYNRVILAGTGNTNRKITLKIAYTKIAD